MKFISRRRVAALGSVLAWVSAVAAGGCLGDPELRSCAEFALGTEGCLAPCQVYCETAIERCPTLFTNLGACLSDCSAERVNPDAVENLGDLGDRAGNTLSCRMTYLLEGVCENAVLEEAANPQCAGIRCEDFCAETIAACGGVYDGLDACLVSCDLLPQRPPNDPVTSPPTDNSVECRAESLQLAGGADCEAASANGGGQCGSPCEQYCAEVIASCEGANAVYADVEECFRVCGYMSSGRATGWAFEDDTIQCRTYHAGRPAVLDPDRHCPHARLYNDEHCGVASTPPPEDWPCPTLCDIMERFCEDEFPGETECLQQCAMLPEVVSVAAGGNPQLFPLTGDCATALSP